MQEQHFKSNHKNLSHAYFSPRAQRVLVSFAGIAVNILISYFMTGLGLPLFLDCLGTLAVSAVTGMLFAGIFTAVVSSLICSIFNVSAIYFGIFNAVVAIYTVWFVRKFTFKRMGLAFLYAATIILYYAAVNTFVLYMLYGESGIQNSLIVQNAASFAAASDLPYVLSLFLLNILVNILDKGMSFVLVLILKQVIPERSLVLMKRGTWKQAPLSDSQLDSIKKWKGDIKKSIRKKNIHLIVFSSFFLVFAMGWIGVNLYFDSIKKERIETAWNTVKAASAVIDPSKVNDFIKYGKETDGYEQTAKLLKTIWKAASTVDYLYVVKVEQEGCRFVFDVDGDGEGQEGYELGHFENFDADFEKYLPDLFAGNQIESVESKTIYGWMTSVYYPLKGEDGKCTCYVAADISLDYMAEYIGNFILRVILIMAGLFLLVIAYSVWISGVENSFPISTMAACVDSFAQADEEQEKLDQNVREIRSLDIHTGDEVEKLYHAICKMTLNQAEQMRDIRRLTESTLKMQDGLIITMADMVESRDSDTGAHVQKTAAYVKIIVEGLKRKGYYAQKITPKFMSDVVRSAPLHDVGKINIPDSVLNKPGKLTDEEYAIMKTHTTAGKKILENAISTVQGASYLKEARNMAAYHHERWDGKGYPEGLHGEVIPLSARIMAVADVFDALASPRVYKPAFPLEKALAILQEGAGSQFDAKCVEVFMDSLSEVKKVLKKYSSEVSV